ncbi:MAG: hypothetical protein U0992_00545 [Planctomycetaceae bacterium]
MDRAVAGLLVVFVGRHEPGGHFDAAVAIEGVAEELHFGERRAGDKQHAETLADEADFGAAGVVVVRELAAGVDEADAELQLGRARLVELVRDLLQRAVHAEDERLADEFDPVAAVATLFDEQRGGDRPACARLQVDGGRLGSPMKATRLASTSVISTLRRAVFVPTATEGRRCLRRPRVSWLRPAAGRRWTGRR